MNITLATLDSASASDVFNQAAQQMLEQGRPSIGPDNNAAYRGLNGLSCPAGCFMGDGEYRREFENSEWVDLIEVYPLTFTKKHSKLIMEFQFLHDNVDAKEWLDNLFIIAKKFLIKLESSMISGSKPTWPAEAMVVDRFSALAGRKLSLSSSDDENEIARAYQTEDGKQAGSYTHERVESWKPVGVDCNKTESDVQKDIDDVAARILADNAAARDLADELGL